MKLSLTALTIFGAIALSVSCGRADKQSFTVKNNLDEARPDEIVSISLADLASDKIAGMLVREEGQQEYLLSQLIDNDMDGKPDEFLFRTSIGPNETKEFILETPAPGTPEPEAEYTTFSRFVPERQNDYAWENDRVAFRVYGSQNNASSAGTPRPGGGIDAFLKRVSYPVINKWYQNNAEEEGAYHIDTGEGYDPYQVGGSRGLGGIGAWVNDSLYVSSSFISSKTIAEGPLRTIFELNYAPWKAGEATITETKRISLDLGSHLSRITEIISSDGQIPDLVAGITLHDKLGTVNADPQEGWFRYWEPMDDSWLGTAIVAEPSLVAEFRDHRSAAPDQSHLYVFLKSAELPVFYAGFAWQKSGHFKTVEEWEKYLSDFSRRIRSPLIVQFR